MGEYCNGGGAVALAPVVSDKYCDPTSERHLTVRKTCLFFPGDGFAVYEHHTPQTAAAAAAADQKREREDENVGREEENGVCGELVFRVDTYGGPELQKRRSTDQLVLMGPFGDCILTIKKKWPSLHQRWEGFLGSDDSPVTTPTPMIDPPDGGAVDAAEPSSPPQPSTKKPLFSVRRSSIIGRFGKGGAFLVDAYPIATNSAPSSPGSRAESGSSERHYQVEGCYPHRRCTVYDGGDSDGRVAVAEISRKVDATTGILLGRDVFCLRLVPGFDAAFAMGLVLALDQICGDDADDDHDRIADEDSSGHSCRCNGGSSSPGNDTGGCSPSGRGSPSGRPIPCVTDI